MFPKTERRNAKAEPPNEAKRQDHKQGLQPLQDKVRHGYAQLQDDMEPRWPAVVALIAGAGLFGVLPKVLSFGPRWLPAAIVGVLLIPTIVMHVRGHHNLNRILGLLVAGVETFFMVASLLKLIGTLVDSNRAVHHESPERLLISAGALWLTNVLVFALWYWHLDAGGPNQRDLRPSHCHGSFLFPQMTMSDERLAESGQSEWSPGFVDYLFLAFNTSTALSPADTAVLSRWAKLLMMIQAAVSLTVIAVVAARAINTLS